jgi:formylglycine-generating enzyme required for sulfatase activity
MAGNVAEWVNDNDSKGENYYIVSPRDNPKGPVRHDAKIIRGEKNDKIFRGGSWEGGSETLRSAWRKALWADYRIDGLGFRCAANM